MDQETPYKRKLRKTLGFWSEAYEPGRGSGVGYPDLQFLVAGFLLPIEVKKGYVEEDRLFSSRIRPSQISWHHEFMIKKGLAFILICTESCNVMNAYATPSNDREVTSRWKEGWPIAACKPFVIGGKVVVDLRSICAEHRTKAK